MRQVSSVFSWPQTSRRGVRTYKVPVMLLSGSHSAGRGRAANFVPDSVRIQQQGHPARQTPAGISRSRHIENARPRHLPLGRIVYGNDYRTLNVKVSTLKREAEKLTDKIASIDFEPLDLPPCVMNRHCAECEFQARCRQKAIEKDDLSLLGNIREKECAVFKSKGIFTVTQLSFTFRPRRRPKGIRDKRERFHYSLRAVAIRENKIHIVGRPEMKIEGTPVYLDVEGLPDRDFYYLIGFRIKAGESVVHHRFWADSPSEEGQMWQAFLSKLMEIEKPVLIHYGSFRERLPEAQSAPGMVNCRTASASRKHSSHPSICSR